MPSFRALTRTLWCLLAEQVRLTGQQQIVCIAGDAHFLDPGSSCITFHQSASISLNFAGAHYCNICTMSQDHTDTSQLNRALMQNCHLGLIQLTSGLQSLTQHSC